MRTLSLLAASTVLVGILVATTAYADSRTLVTIPLRHQLPSQVLPVIQPLLSSGSTAAEFNNQLVLNATDEEVAKILHAAEDRAKRTLQQYVSKLNTLADALLEREILDEDEIRHLIGSSVHHLADNTPTTGLPGVTCPHGLS